MNEVDPSGLFLGICTSASCLLGDLASGLSAVSAFASILSFIPQAEIISFATGLAALAADATNCIAFHNCNFVGLALDVVALIPGAAALKAAHDVKAIEDIIKGATGVAEFIDPELKSSKEFLEFADKIEGVIGALFSGTGATIGVGLTNSSPTKPKCP